MSSPRKAEPPGGPGGDGTNTKDNVPPEGGRGNTLVEDVKAICALPAGKGTPLSQGAKVALIRLRLYAGNDGYAYPSRRNLGNRCGVDRRQASNYLQQLEQARYIVPIERGADSRKPTRYRIDIRQGHSGSPAPSQLGNSNALALGNSNALTRERECPPQENEKTNRQDNSPPYPHGGKCVDGTDTVVQSTPIDGEWCEFVNPERVNRYYREVRKVNATPADLQAWNAAVREFKAGGGDPEVLKYALRTGLNSPYKRDLPDARHLKAEYFIRLAQQWDREKRR